MSFFACPVEQNFPCKFTVTEFTSQKAFGLHLLFAHVFALPKINCLQLVITVGLAGKTVPGCYFEPCSSGSVEAVLEAAWGSERLAAGLEEGSAASGGRRSAA